MNANISQGYPDRNDSDEVRSSRTHPIEAISSDNDNLARLMYFAEQLKEKCEFYVDKIEELIIQKEDRIVRGILLCILPWVIIILITIGPSKLDSWIYIVSFCWSIVILVQTRSITIKFNKQIKRFTRKLRSEDVALEETVNLLRDFGRIIAEQHDWDELRKIELKLRLSRFEIGRYEIPK